MNTVRHLNISIVIPVLNDLAALQTLLEGIAALTDRPHEIIVVDGGQDPAIVALADARDLKYLPSRTGRGHQLHLGAEAATGNVLWFLHADAEPATDSLEAIRRAVRAGALGGYFRFRFAGKPAWYKKWLARLINFRCRYGVPYGDQGLFVRRSAYFAAGGFPDTALFEEVPLIRTVRAAGRFVCSESTIGVSPRRWERDGWIRRTLGNRLLAIGYTVGLPADTLARFYRVLLPQQQMEC